MTLAQLKPEANLLSEGPDALIGATAKVVEAADRILNAAKAGVRIKIQEAGGVDAAQHPAHGLAWLATTVESLRQMNLWAVRLKEEGNFGRFEQLLLAVSFAEYGAQISGASR